MKTRPVLRRKPQLVLQAALVLSAMVGLCHAETPQTENPILQLRVAWGGGEATSWRGSLYVPGGRIVAHRTLGISDDEPGSMWIEGDRLHVGKRTPREYDGVDITVVATLESKLVVELVAGEANLPSNQIEIKLADLVSERYSDQLGPAEMENQLLVQRSPGDRLRVRVLTQSLVFAPGEQLRIELRPHLLGLDPETEIQLQTQIMRARSKEKITSQKSTINVPADEREYAAMPLEFTVPQLEGVYDLVLTAVSPAGGFVRSYPFRNRQQLVAERSVQFVVLGKTSPDTAIERSSAAPEKIVTEIQPASPWWKRVTKISALSGFGNGPLRHGEVQLWQHHRLGKFYRLGPSPSVEQTVWVAYPLTVNQPGEVHILEVEYPSDVSQAMGISILETDAAGDILPIGIDSGVVVSEPDSPDAAAIAKHRVVFWPKTKDPVVLITNGRQDMSAIHGSIRLLGPKNAGISGLGWGASKPARLPKLIPDESETGGRLFAGYMARPLLPENFSATDVLDGTTNRCLDDWVTFYQAGTRLIEYLKYGGYNALVLSVLARGSTIYPSEHLSPTPRYDTGVFFSNAQDPVRKDVLEMLLRMCDRADIRLIPALQFSSPLPALEQQLRKNGERATGIKLVDVRGVSWEKRNGNAPEGVTRYNPLHGDVQQEVLQVVEEIMDRYGEHPSLAGLAIDTAGQGCTLLPGADWGYDEATLRKFSQDNDKKTGVLQATPVTQLGLPSQTAQQAAWLQWRAGQLRDFHGRLADKIRGNVPAGKLYVATTAIQASPDLGPMLRPALPSRVSAKELLLGIGIAPAKYTNSDEGIVLLRSHVLATDFSEIDSATALQIDHSLELDRCFQEAGKLGHLVQNHPREIRLTSFDAKSPFGVEATHATISPHLVPSGSTSRQLLVRSLATADTDMLLLGGWMLSLGQEASLRSLVTTYRRLPVGNFETISGDHDPIVLRKLSLNGATFAYLVNPSAWKCTVTLDLTTEKNLVVEDLSGERNIAPPVRGRLLVSLAAHDFRALRIDEEKIDFDGVEVSFDEDVRDLLEHKINDLADRTIELKQLVVMDVLQNPTFELAEADGQIPGWQLAGGEGTAAEIDRQEVHGGAAALRLRSEGKVAALRSNRFEPPCTGRLSFAVWLKTSADFRGPLRMAISGRHQDHEIYRFGLVPKSEDWQVFNYQIDDLPLSELREMQVRFDLMGKGTVWIDDIVVSDLHFSDNERKELSRILTQAHFALSGGKLAECERILDGYWPRFLQQHVSLPGQLIATGPRPERQAELPRSRREKQGEQTEAEHSWWKKRMPAFLR